MAVQNKSLKDKIADLELENKQLKEALANQVDSFARQSSKVTFENRQLLNVTNNTSDLVLITDGKGKLNYANEAFKSFTGIKNQVALERPELMKFFAPESLDTILSETVPALFKKNKWSGEVNITSKDQSVVPFSLMLWTQKDNKGNFEFFACIARDITDQKSKQREMAILARIPDENPFPVMRISGEGVLEYANKASSKLLQKWEVKQGEMMPDLWKRIIRKNLQDEKNKEFELTAGNRIFELLLSPIQEYNYVNIFGNDITTKKLSGIELKSSERRYRAVVDDQTEFISRFLPNGTITFANKAYCEYFGLDRKMIIGKNLFGNIPRNELIEFKKRLSQLTFENPVVTYDERIKMRDGSFRWQLWTDRAIYDENGKFIEYQSVGQDITKVKLAEEAISQQQQYLRDIIDANPNAIYVRDSEGVIQMINKACSKLFPGTVKKIINKNPEKESWSKKEAYVQLFNYDLQTLNTGLIQVLPELKVGTSDNIRWFQTIKTPIKSPDGSEIQVLSVSTEITDRKLTEEELKFQLDLKEMIATLSAQFINLHWTEIDRVLEESLAIVGKFIKVDRTIITTVENDEIKISKYWTHSNPEEWEKVKQEFEKLKPTDLKWILKPVTEYGYFLLKDAEAIYKKKPKNYELLQQANIKSLLILPMFSKGKPVAYFSLENTRKAKQWNPDTIALFRILTQVFSNAMERRNAEQKLSKRMELEKIITHLSSKFINIDSTRTNAEIKKSLQHVGEFLNVDQAFVILKNQEGKSFNLSHHWSVKHENISSQYLKNIPSKNHVWEFKQLRGQNVLAINKVSELPPMASDLRAIMSLLNITSLLVVPISYEDKFYGALGFTSEKSQLYWSEDVLSLLKILGQVFANALERKKVEESLIEQEEIYRTLAKNIPNSSVFLYDKNLRFKLSEGDGLASAGLSREKIEGKTLRKVLAKELADIFEPYCKNALIGKESTLEKKIGQTYFLMHFLPVRNQNGHIYMGMVVAIDITNLKEIQKELETQTDELRRSNEDLEQFAYAASHDLQEPLRMVSSYVHLIKRRLGNSINGEIHEFMDFATDGAARMQDLINDLLEYSRVDRAGRDFEMIDLHELLQVQETMLQNSIKNANATIEYGKMPKVKGDKSQLHSLFQNLIENAIKFRGDSPPVVEIGYKEYKDRYNIWVKDNGIGIDDRFSERIFVIFQRLNNRANYSGTGIGLAICKKIVERHGGKIWVKSKAGKGSAFYFNLKK